VKRRLRLTLSGLAAIGLCSVIDLTACRHAQESAAIRMDLEIAPWPPRVGPATVTLKLSAADGKAMSGAHVSLEGDMAHPGMRPEFAETHEMGSGRYQAQLDFTMAGDWVILANVTLPGRVTLERQLDVKGVRAN
jgi:hypothetical protein